MSDVQDEHNKNEQYNIQMTLKASKKVLLLTGTPTPFMEQNYEEIHYYSLSDAIQDDLICNYNIYLPEVCDSNTNLPIELDNINQPTMFLLQAVFLVNGMLLHGCTRCIAYLSTIEECECFNNALEEVCDKYHGISVCKEELTSKTTQKRRDEILNNFQNDTSKNIYVIASVRVLDEGVNLVKCDSVFMNAVPNDITFVQRLCRANRKDDFFHPNKVASCFLWENDYENAIHLFKYLSKCDPKFRQKLKLTRSNYDNTSVEANLHLEQANYKLIENIEIRIMSHSEKWDTKLQEVKAYIDTEEKKPNSKLEDKKTKQLGQWIEKQQMKYAKEEMEVAIRVKWEAFLEEYKDFLLSKEEKWVLNLQEVKAYIDKEQKRPSSKSKDEKTKKLGIWIRSQQTKYATRIDGGGGDGGGGGGDGDGGGDNMKEDSIRVKWEAFIKEYKVYFR
jgi:superfamily II DNA or RNA helicase